MILWILGPRFSFFAGTSTHTCIPLLSYLFTQLSVDKHCLLKSAKTASSGKILDILKQFPQKISGLFGGGRSRSSVRPGEVLRVGTLAYLHIYMPTAPLSGHAGFLPFLLPPSAPLLASLPFSNTGAFRTGESKSVRKGQPVQRDQC